MFQKKGYWLIESLVKIPISMFESIIKIVQNQVIAFACVFSTYSSLCFMAATFSWYNVFYECKATPVREWRMYLIVIILPSEKYVLYFELLEKQTINYFLVIGCVFIIYVPFSPSQ